MATLLKVPMPLLGEEVVEIIAHDTAPTLKTLMLDPVDYRYCKHFLLHMVSFKTLAKLNPELQVLVRAKHLYCWKDKLCEACALGCRPWADDRYCEDTLEHLILIPSIECCC